MSNLAQYIDDVRLYVGDVSGTQYSDSLVLLALENAIQYLGWRWESKYLIYSSGIVNTTPAPAGFVNVNTPAGMCTIESTYSEGDVFRNCHSTFTSVAPPIIEQKDLPAVLIAATYLLFRSIAASAINAISWSTPDLSFSNIQSSRTITDFIKEQLIALDLFFKQKLGRIQVGNFARSIEYLQDNSPIDVANYYYRQAQLERFK